MPRVLGWTKARYRRINALLKEESPSKPNGGSLLEGEFEFKPSFDEYLKAMESVKSVRERRRAHSSNELDDSSGRKAEADRRNAKREKLDGDSGRKMASSAGKDGLSRDGMRERRRKLESTEGRANGKGKSEVQGEMAITKKQILNKDSKARRTKASIVVLGGRDITNDYKGIDFTWVGGSKNTEISGKLWRKDERVEKSMEDKINRQSASPMKTRRPSNYKKDDEHFDEERAAFRTLNEFSDVVDKPKASRMEMEDRVQKLAKWSVFYLLFGSPTKSLYISIRRFCCYTCLYADCGERRSFHVVNLCSLDKALASPKGDGKRNDGLFVCLSCL